MPVDKQVLLRYQVLNKCFRNRYREFTIDDLVEECNKAMSKELDKYDGVSKRTIQDDIAKLQMPPYNIRLDENLRRGRKRLYRYYDTDYSLPLYRMNDADRNKIEGAIYVLKQFEGEPLYDWVRAFLMQIEGGLFDEDSSSVVSFQTNPDLKGVHLFGKLLQAIFHKRVIQIKYTPFGRPSYLELVYPYHLKQFNNRWYLIAQAVGYNKLANFALDRMEDFEETDLPYMETDVDFQEYFDDVIGVTVLDDAEPVDVILSFREECAQYVITKPLHLSQRIVKQTNSCTVFSINVKINRELIAQILSFGHDVEVLAPASLRQVIAKMVTKMYNRYQRQL